MKEELEVQDFSLILLFKTMLTINAFIPLKHIYWGLLIRRCHAWF